MINFDVTYHLYYHGGYQYILRYIKAQKAVFLFFYTYVFIVLNTSLVFHCLDQNIYLFILFQ